MRRNLFEHRELEGASLASESRLQVCKRAAPGLADRAVAAGEWNIPKCPRRSKPPKLQTRNSPPHIVPSRPYPVPSSAMPITRPRETIVRHATGDVRMMMLDADGLQPGLSSAKRVLMIVGMQIVGYGHRCDAEKSLQVAQRLAEKFHRFQVFKIPDVLADYGVAILGQAQACSSTRRRKPGSHAAGI